ncbi:stage V sporulation protein K [Schinkia azotoformans MEV2011]|uniref:Stage V sporulation protein K n=1 Tax=Schinkia azotoformans MEV2011 TaxID=1348973 RepID=A0A072P396_SCHAZ|nr:stage V sporulation protein K [Schinkia azotoformans]KEF39965.1 stage V sporulation protein K [Schinkia azotoformans MEV2011]MEC1697263.1 stage V sporulation protein K [Schinkia azotoformans]MEC1714636.1 stage V sporulation protein K [Schinkia azotoformans]MEC1724302.1 stage V sporulation protein K [Schinkia azotoformans]MEC1742913.1 stage V sporulation protein K [Schinkia azotoformans]
MEQPVTLNKNGQINIVLNNENKTFKITKVSKSLEKQQEMIHSKHEPLKRIEAEMSVLVGMEEMKKIIKEIYAWIYINKVREEHGLQAGSQVLHMLFKGNPGTGKTTVARLIGKLLKEMNALSKGHLIEVERADLVGEYIGHTAQKTRDLIKKAMGGILFVDEAYSLARGGEKDFGKEAIDTLVKNMEDKQNAFILILAGYAKEMDQFLNLNPGLRSRFPLVIEFPDYTVDQLMEIAKKMMTERQYVFSKEAEWKLREQLQNIKYNRSSHVFSNGRYIRNVIEKAVRTQAMRLLMNDSYEKTELETILSEDLVFSDL